MSIPCDKGPQLERIEQKLDAIAEIITKQAVQDNELSHLGNRLKIIEDHTYDLVRWKERWGGASIALGAVGTFLGTALALIKFYQWVSGS